MQGRTALAALLASAALSACGQEAKVAPARIEITAAVQPPPAIAPAVAAAPAKPGKVRSGTLKTRPSVAAPRAATPATTGAKPVPVGRPKRTGARRFRAAQLRALRAHCATRPPDDPRCVGGRVDERVAFAPFEDRR